MITDDLSIFLATSGNFFAKVLHKKLQSTVIDNMICYIDNKNKNTWLKKMCFWNTDASDGYISKCLFLQ